ncbi:MAG: TCP-1/cpn60 chaperonin family protein [Bacteroidota bacterium]
MNEIETGENEMSEGHRTLLSNLAAVRAVTSAIEGTLGPKGLDCMLVDENGEVILTNDGVTILQHLEVAHPAARLLIQAARAQERAVGDGTTTATILAGALIGEGIDQILRGVPVTRVIDGLRAGIAEVLAELNALRRPIDGLSDPALRSVALVAGRSDASLAETVLAGAGLLGPARLAAAGFSLAECVLGMEGAADEAYPGVIVEREPASLEMPVRLGETRVILLAGALEPDPLPPEALSTAAGLHRAEARQAAFRAELASLADGGIGLVFAGRGMAESAVQFFAERGILGVRRVADRDLRRVASLCGARLARRVPEPPLSGANPYIGRIASAEFDVNARILRLAGGPGPAEATIVIGGRTTEVVAERERIARDAASSVQQAIKGGVVPGGGAVELALSRALARHSAGGLAAYGLACVREALKRPLAQLAANAGYNPLAKVEEVYTAQERTGQASLGFDPETGSVLDVVEAGVVDPYPVKEHALRTAGEVATAILRINNILKMHTGSREDGTWHDPN